MTDINARPDEAISGDPKNKIQLGRIVHFRSVISATPVDIPPCQAALVVKASGVDSGCNLSVFASGGGFAVFADGGFSGFAADVTRDATGKEVRNSWHWPPECPHDTGGA